MSATAAALPETEAESGEQDLIAPRISVGAFCVTEGFAVAVQSAARDRRMAKVKADVSMGGAVAAARRYSGVSAPNLVIVESMESGFNLFSELSQLAEVVEPETRVIVAGPSNDVGLYRELIRNGVSDYLVTPCAPMQVIESIIGAYDAPDAAPAAASYAVYGVRGGVGASVFAHNLAYEIAERTKKDTILIDLDIEFGTLGLNFNIETKHSTADAVVDAGGLDDVKLARLLHPATDQLKLLPAPADLREREQLSAEAALTLLDVARRTGEQVVIDAPRGWGPAAQVALRQATTPILVASPDLASLRNLRAIAEWVAAERQNDEAPRLVLTQIGQPKRPEIPPKEFGEILGRAIDLTLPWDGAAFGAALNEGKMLREISAGKNLAGAIGGFADQLTGRIKPTARRKGGVGRILSSIGLRQ